MAVANDLVEAKWALRKFFDDLANDPGYLWFRVVAYIIIAIVVWGGLSLAGDALKKDWKRRRKKRREAKSNPAGVPRP